VLDGVVLLHTLEEVLVTAGTADVLDAAVDTLAELSGSDDLGHLNTDGVLGDVENDTSASVVEVVGHTLVLGRINLDIDVVATLEGREIAGHASHTTRAVGLSEFVPGAGAETEGVRHFEM